MVKTLIGQHKDRIFVLAYFLFLTKKIAGIEITGRIKKIYYKIIYKFLGGS
jgi:hypothetical protein